MSAFHLLLASLFLLSASLDIIRYLPYNIYQIEDMNKYENKNLPEGNRFFIRLPKNIKNDLTFYLTIPKDIELFPIYFSEFSKIPNDEEIINTNYQTEINLKDREEQEYSIYSFDIKQTDSYKVIYFQNNEKLNYLSFYAEVPIKYSGIPIFNLNQTHPIRNLTVGDYFYKVKLQPEQEEIIIESKTYLNQSINFDIKIKLFNKTTYDEMANPNIYDQLSYTLEIYSDYKARIYKAFNNDKYNYLGIYLKNNNYLSKADITIKSFYSCESCNKKNNTILALIVKDGWPTWAKILIIVAIIIIIAAIVICCFQCEEGRAFCECFAACLMCCRCGA